MMSDWNQVDEIEKINKKYERVRITVYQRGNDFSFGTSVSLKTRGWRVPVLEEPYMYQSKNAAIKAAVDYIKERIKNSADYQDSMPTILRLLPDVEPSLFDFEVV